MVEKFDKGVDNEGMVVDKFNEGGCDEGCNEGCDEVEVLKNSVVGSEALNSVVVSAAEETDVVCVVNVNSLKISSLHISSSQQLLRKFSSLIEQSDSQLLLAFDRHPDTRLISP